ncbi:MAG TPA: hypothetical protein VF115_10450 [Acidimicrobiia bacterium]
MSGRSAHEVRREAFEAAAVAVDRFLERVGDPVSGGVNDLGTVAWDRFRSELARVVDLNLETVRNAFGLYGSLIGPESLKPDPTGSRLVFSPGAPGSEAGAVLWLHNFDDAPIVNVGLVGSRLSTNGGEAIDNPGWSFTPATVSVPPRSALPVVVTVPIPDGAAGGSYGGTITAKTRPADPIEVRVDVIVMGPVAHDSW